MTIVIPRDPVKAEKYTNSSSVLDDPFQESVYRLIPEVVPEKPHPPLYKSIFSNMAKSEYTTGTKPAASMGPVKVKVNPPKEFLKKHSKEPRLPPPKEFHYADKGLRPSVPSKKERPVLPKPTSMDFVTTNAVNIINSTPQKVPKEPYSYLTKKDYGKNPKYLDKRKEERHNEEVQRQREEALANENKQYQLLPEEERLSILAGLQAKLNKLNTDYQKLSLTVDTIPKINRKVGIENQLKALEQDIAKFSKPNMYVKKRLAQDGANIAIAAKTADPNPKLPGTIYSAAEEIEKIGGKALPIQCDIRDEEQIKNAIEKTVASAISLTSTEETTSKKFDLMNQINLRGTFLMSKHAIPYLKKSTSPKILMISPPLCISEIKVIRKSNMLNGKNIAVNALWPKTVIDTAALQAIGDKEQMGTQGRKPEIMADAAYILLSQPASYTGIFAIDEELLKNESIPLEQYATTPGNKDFLPDFFLDEGYKHELPNKNKKDIKSPKSVDLQSNLAFNEMDKQFSIMNEFEKTSLMKSINGILEFIIKGNEKEEKWTLDLKKSGKIYRGAGDLKPDISITLKDEDFMALYSGKLSGISNISN
ncbi:hypothetical protein ROZALSC1DRAFT_28687 [Rozella allomycis CSF55]|uniref:Hydroxysteroid dehydrogenase-like protein 2 n=1 Tax=Rozella allomycis (strain CSF55) TaxID=988480 RepID=A0A4P9YJH5_ROZAC|nr:hypothetical protein ROZALSC1DRAFT_28687 [Rozella allomycis CSF55]